MKWNLRTIGAFAVLGTLALAVSCKGFFVNPTITSVTIDPPSPTVSIGQSTPLTALGQDNQGDAPVTLSGGTSCTGDTVCWSSSTPSVATISTGGTLTGVSAGTTTITAASGTATGTATATVTLANITSITIQPTSITLTENTTATGSNCAIAIANPGGVDVTTSVTWQTNPSTLVEVFNGVTPMCVESTQQQTGTTALTATYQSGNTTVTSNTVTVTVTP